MTYFSFFSTLYLYLPIITKEFNLNNQYIGIIGFFYSLGSVFSSFLLANFIENSKHKNTIIKIIMLINSILIFSLIFIKNYFFLLFAVFLIGYFGASFVGSNISRSKNKGITIGISSIGFIIGYLIGGILENYNTMLIIISSLFLFLLILNFFTPIFEDEIEKKEDNKSINPFNVIKTNWFIYLSLFLRHIGAASIWIYLSYILLNYYHFNLHIIGILNAINILVQTFSNPLIYVFLKKDNRSIIKLISFGFLLSATYFLFFPLTKNIWILSLLQLILGLSFTALYLGTIEYLSENNEEKVTAITLISSTFSLANAVGAVLSVFLIKLGYTWLFINGFILASISFLIILSVLRNKFRRLVYSDVYS